jgi:hypothetical protein
MNKRKAVFFSFTLLFSAMFLWGGTWLEQMSRSFAYDLATEEDKVSVTWSSGNANDNHMVGDIGCSGLNSSIKSIVVKISAPSGYSFTTPQDISAKRNYVLQIFARGNRGSGDENVSSSLISCSGSGIQNTAWGSDYVGSTEVGWVKDGTLTMVIGAGYYGTGNFGGFTPYDSVHIDIVLTLPTISNIDDLCKADDYSSSFTVEVSTSQNKNGTNPTLLDTLPYTIMGYYDVSPGSSDALSFTITPSDYASYYPLDDASVTASAATVGTVNCFTNAKVSGKVTNKANLPYAIVLSATSNYLDTSTSFAFVNSSDATKTIPYTAQITKSSDYSTHTFTTSHEFCKSTTTGLHGTESVSLSSDATTDRRFVLVPQEDCGANGSTHYYRYWYQGDIQILLAQSEITKISNKDYPAGSYNTTLYLTLVQR